MKKQKNILRCMYWALPCAMLFAGCENGTDGENTEPVELQINPVVATTRSAIQEASSMTEVAVYATGGNDYTTEKNNNYAKYAYSGGSWNNNETDKIFLTNAAATIYGYYPATNRYNETDKTISVTLVEGDATTTITAVDNASSSSTTIASATAEVDCMWATPVNNVSNAAGKSSVKLTMQHALSMVSFRVYKDASYKGAGSLTQFIVENAAGKSMLSKGTSPKMNITNGIITPGTARNAKYTRSIQGGYTLVADKDASKKFSFLVLPINESIGNDNIQATFTVDGADYPVNLKAPTATGTDGKWLAGNNNLYTVKLGGTDLEVTTVEVTKWSEVAGDDLEIK